LAIFQVKFYKKKVSSNFKLFYVSFKINLLLRGGYKQVTCF